MVKLQGCQCNLVRVPVPELHHVEHGSWYESGGMGNEVARGNGETEKAFEVHSNICKIWWRFGAGLEAQGDGRVRESFQKAQRYLQGIHGGLVGIWPRSGVSGLDSLR